MKPRTIISLLSLLLALGTFLFQNSRSSSPFLPSNHSTQPATSSRTFYDQLGSPLPRSKTVGCTIHGGLPDRDCTPGAIDPRVRQETISSTICTQGYTKTVRPPVTYTDSVKRQQMQAYGFLDNPKNYELDHLIPLELGGNPTDVANLWPEPATPVPGFHEKDSVENYLHEQVCNGVLSLAKAQQEIVDNWVAIYRQLSPSSAY